MLKMKSLSAVTALFMISWILLGAARTHGGAHGGTHSGAHKMPTPRVYALIFKADWCANCRVMGPKAMRVLPEFIPQGVAPVELDMTNEATSAKALVAAEKLGVKKLVEGNDGTGFVVLVDAEKKTKLGKITANMTEGEMKAAFEAALSKTKVRK